jgi:mono/diheme cytochrome c family protein
MADTMNATSSKAVHPRWVLRLAYGLIAVTSITASGCAAGGRFGGALSPSAFLPSTMQWGKLTSVPLLEMAATGPAFDGALSTLRLAAPIPQDRARDWLLRVPRRSFEMVNPNAPTAASLARGLAAYDRLCVACHGKDGRGSTVAVTNPIFRGLNAKPLHRGGSPTLPDGVIVWVVQNGIDGTAMHSASHVVTESEAWDLANFLRAIAQSSQGTSN